MSRPFVLTDKNYFSRKADTLYWSASQFKAFLKCPACAVAELKGKWQRKPSDALLIGSYVDVMLTGTEEEQDQFVKDHPEMLKRDGTFKAEFVRANDMVYAALGDRTFMSYLKGDKQTIVTGQIDGIPFKAKYDVFLKGKRIVDLKTVKDFSSVYLPGEGKVSFADAWNWPLQMAIYQELEGHKLPVFLACVTKQDPPAKDIVSIPQEKLDAELAFVKEKLPLFDAMKKGVVKPTRCEDCAYCRATRKIKKPTDISIYEEFGGFTDE